MHGRGGHAVPPKPARVSPPCRSFGCAGGEALGDACGRIVLESWVAGVGFSIAGSTSFGLMTPPDLFSLSLRLRVGSLGFAPGAIFSGTVSGDGFCAAD